MTDRFYFSLFLYEAFATFLPYAASDHVVHFLGYGQRLVHQLVGHYHKKGGSQLVAAQLHISFADIALARESERAPSPLALRNVKK